MMLFTFFFVSCVLQDNSIALKVESLEKLQLILKEWSFSLECDNYDDRIQDGSRKEYSIVYRGRNEQALYMRISEKIKKDNFEYTSSHYREKGRDGFQYVKTLRKSLNEKFIIFSKEENFDTYVSSVTSLFVINLDGFRLPASLSELLQDKNTKFNVEENAMSINTKFGLVKVSFSSGDRFVSKVEVSKRIGDLYSSDSPDLHVKNDFQESLEFNYSADGLLKSMIYRRREIDSQTNQENIQVKNYVFTKLTPPALIDKERAYYMKNIVLPKDGQELKYFGPNQFIKKEYKGGQVVESVDQASVKVAEQVQFQPQKRRSWLSYIAVTGILLAVPLLLYILRRK